MAYYTIKLTAGVPYPQRTAGRIILIDNIGVAPGVDVALVLNDSESRAIPARRAGFKLVEPFTGVIFTASVDCTIAVFLSMADVDLGWVDGMQVAVSGSVEITNDAAHRVPVEVGGGVINVTATNVGVNNTDVTAVPVRNQALATIVDAVPVSVGVAATSLSNDATLRKLRVRNGHASALVGLGGSGVTLANAAIILNPGEVWIEEDAAGAHWYAISDTAATPVQLQGLKP